MNAFVEKAITYDPVATLNTATGAYLALRVLYIAFYINTTGNRYSYFRTATWCLSTAILFGLFIKAGNVALNV